MDVAKTFFTFYHDQLGQRSTLLCNVYGGTEMMDNICDTCASWNEVVSPLSTGASNQTWGQSFNN